MKQYKVTVNGQSYDVVVEEVGADPARQTAPAQIPPPPRQTAPAAAAAPAPSAAPAPAPTPSMAGVAVSTTIRSPMPGTVLSFKVEVGQEVKRGDVLLILEAMKMENEIVATNAGRVVALKVSAGSSVNTGDSLVDLA